MYIYEVVSVTEWANYYSLWVCQTEEIAKYLLDWENACLYNSYINWLRSPECKEDRASFIENEGSDSYLVWSHYEPSYKIIKSEVITSIGGIAE